jgi:hypothetical protein
VTMEEYEQMSKDNAERFWSSYYDEPCTFPTLSTRFWRAQRARAARR